MICSKCKQNLPDDSKFCQYCGSKIENNDVNCVSCETLVGCCSYQNNDEISYDKIIINSGQKNKEVSAKKHKHSKKILMCFILGIILLASIIVFSSAFLRTRVVSQDIDLISGCPEFYDLKWEMKAQNVDGKIKLKHTYTPAIREFDFSTGEVNYTDDAVILIEDKKNFRIYGRKTEKVFVYFDGDALNSVVIVFSNDDYSFDAIVELYTKIYGSPMITKEKSVTWEGTNTEIDVLYTDADNTEEVVVVYEPAHNTKYKFISFAGSGIDPFGFLNINYAFNKRAEYFIEDLEEGEDYHKEVISPEGEFNGFSQYTLYPLFEYMGVEAGKTAFRLYQEENEENIGLFSYVFLLNEDNAVDIMANIYSKLTEIYDAPNDTIYTSTYYAKMGINHLSYEEIIQKISQNTEGIYSIQWENDKRRVTLGLTIGVGDDYYEGSVSFTNK